MTECYWHFAYCYVHICIYIHTYRLIALASQQRPSKAKLSIIWKPFKLDVFSGPVYLLAVLQLDLTYLHTSLLDEIAVKVRKLDK